MSGGNQQKSLMARELLQNPRVLMLSEPTRGIDVGSKVEIYKLIDAMAHAGMGAPAMSTELPEILGIADRIIVMYEGRITVSLRGRGHQRACHRRGGRHRCRRRHGGDAERSGAA